MCFSGKYLLGSKLWATPFKREWIIHPFARIQQQLPTTFFLLFSLSRSFVVPRRTIPAYFDRRDDQRAKVFAISTFRERNSKKIFFQHIFLQHLSFLLSSVRQNLVREICLRPVLCPPGVRKSSNTTLRSTIARTLHVLTKANLAKVAETAECETWLCFLVSTNYWYIVSSY